MVLGLSHQEVTSIEVNYSRDMKNCLKEIIRKWLEGKGSGPPSWKSLCEALRHPLIEREDMASKIEKKYVIAYLHKEREGGNRRGKNNTTFPYMLDVRRVTFSLQIDFLLCETLWSCPCPHTYFRDAELGPVLNITSWSLFHCSSINQF